MNDWHQKVAAQRPDNADFLLIDRSGSMMGLWSKAMEAVNDYVKVLKERRVDTRVTVALFDNHENSFRFDIIRDGVWPSVFIPIQSHEATPRGMTPLNDAVGRIVSMAKSRNAKKTAVVIVTDGGENYSREVSTDKAKALLDEIRSKGWEVVMLGADWDAGEQAHQYAVSGCFVLNSSGANLRSSLSATASNRASWSSGEAATMAYSPQQKAEAKP